MTEHGAPGPAAAGGHTASSAGDDLASLRHLASSGRVPPPAEMARRARRWGWWYHVEYWMITAKAWAQSILIYAIAALGLNILVGYGGQVSLGTGGFMAVGAYATYKLSTAFPEISLLIHILLAGGITAAVEAAKRAQRDWGRAAPAARGRVPLIGRASSRRVAASKARNSSGELDTSARSPMRQ